MSRLKIDAPEKTTQPKNLTKLTGIHSSNAQEEDGGRRGESPMMRKYHAGFGREGACFLPEAIRAWQRTLTSGQDEEDPGADIPCQLMPLTEL